MLSLWRQKCVCSTSCLREKARKLEAEVSRAFGVPTGRVWDEIGLFFQISGANTCESEVVGAVEMEGVGSQDQAVWSVESQAFMLCPAWALLKHLCL